MKKKIILLTGPQGGGKSYTIERILAKLDEVICIDGVGSIEEIDDILFKYKEDDRTLVIATILDEDHLRSITKGLNIQVVHCNYMEGEIPSVYRMLN